MIQSKDAMIPQLRVRTEYSFRKAFGPVKEIAARLQEIGCPAAGIVDISGTWGHVDWEKELKAAGIVPLFGVELKIEREDDSKPSCWILAQDLPSFYRVSSNPPRTQEEMKGLSGVIRFAGAALDDPGAFDYIDINPRSRRRTAAALALAEKTGKPLVITSDNDYPAPEDVERFLAWEDSLKMTPQHILDVEELRAALWYIPEETFQEAVRNTLFVAGQLSGLSLRRAPIIKVDGSLEELVEAGRQDRLSRGHILGWTQEYQERLEKEMKLIRAKQYESYFLVVSDLVRWAKSRMLVGPARGSSAGSLVCYLTHITEVDPLVHGLIFERFIDINRSDLPDIDIDFNDQKRHLVFEYLVEKYGRNNVARIGSINRLKPRSVMAHVGKKLGIPHGATFNVANVLIEHSSGSSLFGSSLQDTLTGTQPGRDFIAKYPEAQVMTDLEEHASHSGVHAAGIIVCIDPIIEYCTVRDGVAQIDKKQAEYLNLLKIDALGLRTLGVIEDTGCMTPQELYDLKLDSPECFGILNQKKFSGIFQFEGAAQRRVAININFKEFKDIDHVTALSRPGPLGGGATESYVKRISGEEKITYRHPTMETYLGDTLGLVLYQEQVMNISRNIGKLSWEVVSDIRKAMSASKGEEYFNRHGESFKEGAKTLGLTEEEGQEIWDEIVSFGAWGMNKSHTVSYAIISYWCCYMKAHHHLEYAAACLRNAMDDDQVMEILRELTEEGVPYCAFDPGLSGTNWAAADGKLLGGFTNLVGIGPVKAQYYVDKRAAGGLSAADLAKLEKHKPKHQDLRPAHTLWGDIYDNPDKYNIHGRVKNITELKDFENVVIIGQATDWKRRDKNEAVLVNKRGKRLPGKQLFLDIYLVDDTTAKPIIARINPPDWDTWGLSIADNAIKGKDWFLVRGQWLERFSLLNVKKIKCLTNKEMI